MNKQFYEGFREAIHFVFTKVGAQQPAREIVEAMEAYLRKIKRTGKVDL